MPVVKVLLEKGGKVNQARTDEYGATPLFIACYNGHEAVVERLLAQDAINVNQATTDTGGTPLFIACQKGHEAVVERLLAQDAIDVNQAKTNTGTTPLHIACEMGHEAVVERLLEKGADMSIASPRFGTPLAVAQRNSHASIVAILRHAVKK